MPVFRFDNSFARDLPAACMPCRPLPAPAPALVFLNPELADELGLDPLALDGPVGASIFAGNVVPEGAEPVAQAYAGHQFGGFSPQLGDGRAVLLGELIDRDGRRRDLALKGSGRTPFSRGGDGKAALGPMLREVIVGEAMQALGIPTTRALAVASTGEPVRRDRLLPGAVLARVASSHLRVGTFQYFAARGDLDTLRQLVDYAITRHDPALAGAPDRPMAWLAAVARRQAALLAQWMNVGFIHGVMNTDNMTISGETIDYGPCAFMEAYDPSAVFSSIDHGGRYAYANQPLIARWNLARLAETVLPLVADADDDAAVRRAVAAATEVIDAFPRWYDDAWRAGLQAKLGLRPVPGLVDDDAALADAWLAMLLQQRVDFTLAWRRLGDAAEGDESPLRALVADRPALDDWLQRWRARCAQEDAATGSDMPAVPGRAQRMQAVNPFIIPRNHLVEAALDAATGGDLSPFDQLLTAVRQPFVETAAQAHYGQPAPPAVTAAYQTLMLVSRSVD